MDEKKLFDTLESDAQPKGKFIVAKKLATTLAALSMSVFVALGTIACGGNEQEP